MARKSIPAVKARLSGGAFQAGRGWGARRFVMTGLAAAAAVLLAACSSYGTGQTGQSVHQTEASQGVVSVRSLPGIGTVLVDRSGRTVYSPQQEANGQISCTGSCLSFWFPVTLAPGTALTGSSEMTGVLGTIDRADGVIQLTYDGKPLYTFRLDKGPGQARGNDFTDHFGGATFTWHAITAGGTPAGPGQQASPGSYSYPGY
jgi:predicted lipoprotein with Yx(FWY)xxD motif